ncbi:putative lipoprotein B precursor transmembrane [Thiobacillus denitrificans ATCC 25259]|uniref:LPS-assembly lipoprotein LptE n=1 Tax=Thiobacillus denitrificans (strain ATCC 25259 / T1) TaxID=292415 RepID=Q3SG59_THIDA|nr:LPS assembly lipoprotein LptE [Thiobacillus denitrificans]AAZ98397.1 putative lipoprotein B precursor transmembrane [Thiobacillus denitrificans ATCC 25259]
MNRRLFLAVLPAALAAGCGFQLRRTAGIPFKSLYLDAPGGSAVAQRLRSLLTANRKTRLVTVPGEAEALLKLTQEVRSKRILSLSGAGRVTEYRLGLTLSYSIVGPDERVLAEPESLELNRDMTYDDSQLLAKGAEEQLLYRDMEDSAARRILRRLQALGGDT